MPPLAPGGTSGGTADRSGPGLLTELLEAGGVILVLAVVGAVLGVLWEWLAPSVPLVGEVSNGAWAVYLKDSEGEQAIGVDGTFTLLSAGFGVVSAVAVFLWRRRGGVPLVVALGVGALLGSVVAWRVGIWLGPDSDVIARARAVGKGVTFSAPLELGAMGALLAWPFVAVLVQLCLTAAFGPREPEISYGGLPTAPPDSPAHQ